MASNCVKYKELQPNPKIEDLEDRYYTPREASILLNCHYKTVVSHIRKGNIYAETNFGGFYRIPYKEIVRILGGDVEDKRYMEYTGTRIPHMPYMMYAMIESVNDYDEISKRMAEFRLARLSKKDMDNLWESLLEMAPGNIALALRRGKSANNMRGFREWVEGLNISPLFDNIVYPCRNILLDHSQGRFFLEALIGGRVALSEISEFIERRFGKIYAIDQLKFFQYYFYSCLDFTSQEYAKYVALLSDPDEIKIKRQAWDDPRSAKLHVGIPTRTDVDDGFNQFSEVAIMELNRRLRSGRLDIDDLKKLNDIFSKSTAGMQKHEKHERENIDEARNAVASQSDNIQIEQVYDERVVYEDLDQEPIVKKDDEQREGTVQVG